MKPVIEDTKVDKITQENFESIRTTLCGNISLDNMSLRILEGTTDTLSDTSKQIIHSGNSRPVGWFPLVGDVYVQEITDKYIDVRSTKPETNFKILVLFGQAITQESLKAIGGENYKDTKQVIETTTITEETIVIDGGIKMQPIVVAGSALANPYSATCQSPLIEIGHVVTNSTHAFATEASVSVATSMQTLRRVNLTTGVVDLLTIAASTNLGAMILDSTNLYVFEVTRVGLNYTMYTIDLATYTHTATTNWTGGPANATQISNVIWDSGTNCWFAAGTNGVANSNCLYKLPVGGGAGGAQLQLSGAVRTNGRACQIIPYSGSLYVIGMETDKNTLDIYQVDPVAFNVTATFTTPGARLTAQAAILYGTDIVMPVCYDSSRAQTVAIAGSHPFGYLFFEIPTGNFYMEPCCAINPPGPLQYPKCIVELDDYIYSLQVSDSGGYQGGVMSVVRWDAILERFDYFVFPWYQPISSTYHVLNVGLFKVGNTLYAVSSGSSNRGPLQYFELDFSNIESE